MSIRRTALPAAAGGGWSGLALDVDAPARPGLRAEAAGAGRFLLRRADRVVLLARQHPWHYGVHYARTGDYRSPVPPVPAALARRIRETSVDDAAWTARWAHHLVDRLAAAVDGPLHQGSWVLADGMPRWAVAGHWERLRRVDPDRGHITWFGYGHPDDDQRDVLPLRRLAPDGSGRVRAWRRQARDGILPPVLLWWVSGLNTLTVLDGHDRIVAALAEGGPPPVLVLAPAVDPVWRAAWQRHEERGYAERTAHAVAGDATPAWLASLSHRYADALRDTARTEGRTRAWPLRGGAAGWDRLAARLAPGWRTDDRP
ncbi:hypothetical protein [Micromonospora auratinigra]|uniref:Uncharacterized protein n=1 Tax=Micromonospora auratinigra TaxID=261654 RepID=A0A1A8ZB52_9ACTN|nr:hypothetical protein [Micromonospora auratinigra]SBT41095.1 hypothetical protein GA0070611_1497 [Micromonospora auratinigra]